MKINITYYCVSKQGTKKTPHKNKLYMGLEATKNWFTQN